MQIETIILATYIISLTILFVFASHGYSMVYYYFKTFNKRTEDLSEEELQLTEYPQVTIQLPLYNFNLTVPVTLFCVSLMNASRDSFSFVNQSPL